MCFGAAFIAANSSSGFKVRKVFLTQHPRFEYRIEINSEPPQKQDANSDITYKKDVTLFKKTDYLGQKKTMALTYDKNMKVDVYKVNLDESKSEELLATYLIDEIEDIVKNNISKKENTTLPKVSLQFELTRSHLLQLNKVEAKIDEQVRVPIKPNKTLSNDTKGNSSKASNETKQNTTKSLEKDTQNKSNETAPEDLA